MGKDAGGPGFSGKDERILALMEAQIVPRIAKTLCANSSQSLDSDLEDFVVAAPRLASTLTAGQAKPGVSVPGRRQEDDHNIVAFHMIQDPINGAVSPALGARSGGMGVGVAYVAETVSTVQAGGGERGYRIDAEGAAGGHLIAFALRGRDDGSVPEVHGDGNTITDGTIVRRLTPLETCRLQGYPDGHTATSNGQPQADGPQYKQHGNGIAVPMFAWVAKRIAAVDREAAA